MGSFSNYWENKTLNHNFGKAAYTAPTSIFIGLSIADPLDTGLGLAEPIGSAYARVETVPADWNSASGGIVDNIDDITFPQPTGDWGTITHFALFDQDRTSHAITGVNTGTKTFTVAGDQTSELAAGTLLAVDGSTGNDGMYTVVSSTYDTDHTDIVVAETIPDATVDGNLYPCGNILGADALSTPRVIGADDPPPFFPAGDLDVTLD